MGDRISQCIRAVTISFGGWGVLESLKGKNKTVGIKQTTKAVAAGNAKLFL